MKRLNLKTLIITAFATLALAAIACGGNDSGNGAAGGGTTMPVTQALLDALPDYQGATLVREWLTNGGSVHVREYAVAESPEQAADAVTRHYRDSLVKEGWQESEARAAVSSFTKDGRTIVLGRVGSQLQEAPDGASILFSAATPASSGFFFTMEASES